MHKQSRTHKLHVSFYSEFSYPNQAENGRFNRPLADGTVHCASSATYQICFRLPIPNPNPNPITDPNPNPNPKNNKKKENDTGIKLNI